jgi:hypothetical protein
MISSISTIKIFFISRFRFCRWFCLIQSQKHVNETIFDIFYQTHNRSILFVLYEFTLLSCFRIWSIFYIISDVWSWYRSLTSSKNHANVLFNTRFKFVFICCWRSFYKLSFIVCFLFCSLMTIFFWNFSYHYCLRLFNVKMSCCRHFLHASTKRFLIQLQKSFINVWCSFLFNLSRAVICK